MFDEAYPYCDEADDNLAVYTRTNVTQLRKDLAFAIMRNTRLFIDDAAIFSSAYSQARPCDEDSFGNDSEGLEGGGCCCLRSYRPALLSCTRVPEPHRASPVREPKRMHISPVMTSLAKRSEPPDMFVMSQTKCS